MDLPLSPTVHQLRIFLILAEELHYGRAAARLFVTQPALSRQILALERRLGVSLFERNSRSVRLTPAGAAVLPEARAVVDAMREVHRASCKHARSACGQVIIGTVGAEGAMPYAHAILEELRRRNPRLCVEMRLLDLVDHFRALERGEVDVVFGRPPVPEGVATLHLATEPRVVGVSADHPLAARTSVTLKELTGEPVIDHPEECPQVWREFWAADPRPDGSPVVYGPVVRDVETALTTVAQGRAIVFHPAAARSLFPRPGVVYLDVEDLPPCTSALAWNAASGDHPNVVAVRRAARAAWTNGRQGSTTNRCT
ncbi:LysR family transcriptional regulator [Spirillospora sp. CA-294931]|uniref:LysR family transcriptional regulator n=1 Tax=Spirillospora sp. CA-294931 TaxID=3240042 RepID=UPI003D92EEDB